LGVGWELTARPRIVENATWDFGVERILLNCQTRDNGHGICNFKYYESLWARIIENNSKNILK
jgi:hypothetical protein